MSAYVKNTILRERYDITPWKMKEWRDSGEFGIGRNVSDESVVRRLLGAKEPVPRSSPRPVPKQTPRPVSPASDRPSVSIEEAARILHIKPSTLKSYRDEGRYSGPHGRVWESELPIDEPPSMSAAEAAQEWGCSTKQIYEWKTQGVLHGPRGRVWLTEDKPEKGQYRRRQAHNPGSPEVPTRSISGYRVNHSASPDFRPFRD